MSANHTLLHATAVAVEGRAALIIGPSGAGKSDLALRTITMPVRHGSDTAAATLVADDQVCLTRNGQHLIASPPAATRGLIEVRGVGILTFPHVAAADVALIASVDPRQTGERLPDPLRRHTILGLDFPLIILDPRHVSAHIKLVLALRQWEPGRS